MLIFNLLPFSTGVICLTCIIFMICFLVLNCILLMKYETIHFPTIVNKTKKRTTGPEQKQCITCQSPLNNERKQVNNFTV